MAAASAMGNAASAATTATSAVPPTRCVQFCDQPVRQLACKLKALDIVQSKTSNSKSQKPKESMDLLLIMEPSYYTLPWKSVWIWAYQRH